MLAVNNQNNHDISEQDYLEGEKVSAIKHDYINGHVYAMAGSSKRHNAIALNIAIALRLGSRNSHCDVYMSDIKVRIHQGKRYYYPDVVVSCAPDDDIDDHYLEKPCFIVEVLSPSTERKDGTEKLVAYQNIASLQAYMIVDQSQCKISLISRENNGHLAIDYFEEMTTVVPIACRSMSLKVSDIYDGVILDIR